ncbi:MAG: Gfo/Idh/MocA family protein, partial [Thermomicrobiales bacterium]
MNDANVRVGIAGLGRFGKLHAATLAGLPGVEVVAVCDPDASQVDLMRRRYGVQHGHGSLEEMLAAGGLDAVFVVSPEQLHGGQAMQVIERGLPLFIEKPLAGSAEEGARIVAAAKAADVPLQLGFVVRFEAQHALLRAEIAAGHFGQIVSIRLKRNCSRAWFPDYANRIHTVYETSIHDIDLAIWLADSPCTTVYAVDRNYSGHTYPDACFAMLSFQSGTVAMIETSWFVPQGAPANVLTGSWHGTIDAELELIGVERTARFRLLDSGLAIWRDDLTHIPETG